MVLKELPFLTVSILWEGVVVLEIIDFFNSLLLLGQVWWS